MRKPYAILRHVSGEKIAIQLNTIRLVLDKGHYREVTVEVGNSPIYHNVTDTFDAITEYLNK